MQEYYSVYEQQSLWDIATVVYGNPNYAINLCNYNNLSITEKLIVGQKIKLPIELEKNRLVLGIYKQTGIIPATAKNELQNVLQGGIGFMQLGTTFIIS